MRLLLLASAAQIELHGSGTTNPRKFFYKTMDLFEERSKMPLYMTYRAVGSGTGQTEFVGAANSYKPHNHFGSGDIPMSADKYQTMTDNGGSMVHVPFQLGAIAVFHSVPCGCVTAERPIDLDGCTLAKIFSRQITTWDDPIIKQQNPWLDVPAGAAINVVHRQLGSSSTSGFSAYLDKTCGADWPLGVGKTLSWDPLTTGAQGSGGVTDVLKSVPFSITYLDAGHGHSEGLSEIALQNADGNYLTSSDADIGAAGTSALDGVIPTDPSADWSHVNLLDLAGPQTWPITLFSYFYLQKDMSSMDPQSAGLLKAFVEFAFSDEGQESLKDFHFTPVSAAVKAYNMNTLAGLTWPAGMPTFEFETADNTRPEAAAGDYVISAKRQTYKDIEIKALEGDVAEAKSTASGADHSSQISTLKSDLEAQKLVVESLDTDSSSGGSGDDADLAKTLSIVAIVLSVLGPIVTIGILKKQQTPGMATTRM